MPPTTHFPVDNFERQIPAGSGCQRPPSQGAPVSHPLPELAAQVEKAVFCFQPNGCGELMAVNSQHRSQPRTSRKRPCPQETYLIALAKYFIAAHCPTFVIRCWGIFNSPGKRTSACLVGYTPRPMVYTRSHLPCPSPDKTLIPGEKAPNLLWHRNCDTELESELTA
jgi:hypothetical protein